MALHAYKSLCTNSYAEKGMLSFLAQAIVGLPALLCVACGTYSQDDAAGVLEEEAFEVVERNQPLS